MAKAIKRTRTLSDHDGLIHYTDAPCDIAELDKVAGVRLDRRKSWALIDDTLCDLASWSEKCSGCEGGGCRECGYHGRSRRAMWVPWHAGRDSTD